MSEATDDFELPNVAEGPNPFRLGDVATRVDVDAVVVLFQRDYYCTKCRSQVQNVAERYDEFENANAMVAAVLPEPEDRTRSWQERYDLPYALLSDASNDVAETYDQPTRFGVLGSVSDFLARMPLAVVLDTRDDAPEVAATAEGDTPSDRPAVDDLLAAVENPKTAEL